MFMLKSYGVNAIFINRIKSYENYKRQKLIIKYYNFY